MGRATSVKENTSLSGAENLYSVCPGSITCENLRAGGSGEKVVCELGAKSWAGGSAGGCGASGKSVASAVPGVPGTVCPRPAPPQTMAKNRQAKRRHSGKEFFKTPLPASSFIGPSNLCEAGDKTQ